MSPAVEPLDQLLHVLERRDPRAEEGDLLVDQVLRHLEADRAPLAHVGASAPVAGALEGQQPGGGRPRAIDARLAAVAAGPVEDPPEGAVVGLEGDVDQPEVARQRQAAAPTGRCR